MVNRYAGDCSVCGTHVGSGAGECHRVGRKWMVRCVECVAIADVPLDEDEDLARQTRRMPKTTGFYARTNTGAEIYRNARGRCEDAPCCGCCS